MHKALAKLQRTVPRLEIPPRMGRFGGVEVPPSGRDLEWEKNFLMLRFGKTVTMLQATPVRCRYNGRAARILRSGPTRID